MSIRYQIKMRRERWLAGAGVTADLRIENRGGTVFEFPDPGYRASGEPRFELTGPGGSHAFRPDSRPAAEGMPAPEIIRIPPGGEWEGDLVLTQYAYVHAPGRYTLQSSIAHEGDRVESQPVEFEVVEAATKDIAAAMSFGENNVRLVEAVEFMEGGEVFSSPLRESDPRNAELMPPARLPRGRVESGASHVYAPYSNFAAGLTRIRWTVAEQETRLTVGHRNHPRRAPLFDGRPLDRILAPVATESALIAVAVRNQSELLLQRVPAVIDAVAPSPVVTIARLNAPPVAVGLTISPAASGNTLLIALAAAEAHATRVQLFTVTAAGKVLARTTETIPGVRPMPHAAAGWSTAGDLRAAFLVRGATQATEIRVAELRLTTALALNGPPRLGEPVRLDFPLADARFAYFEQAGQLARMLVVRTTGDRVLVFPREDAPRAPYNPLPATGPLAILPGELLWYAAWPEKGQLVIAAI